MGAVMIRCPRTGRTVSTEIETEPSVFSRLPEVGRTDAIARTAAANMSGRAS